MSARPSTSAQLRTLDNTFENDCSALESSIRELKSKVKYGGAISSSSQKERSKSPAKSFVYNATTSANTKLSERAKGLRNMTENRFATILEGWKRQVATLEQELDTYKSQQRISAERIVRRNEEVKKLENEKDKLTNLLRKCEQRINDLFDAKEQEKKERMRADKLADQLFEHKSMINDLQSQLKEAERLIDTNRAERSGLTKISSDLKRVNFALRGRLEEAEKDTQETKLELEMIEEMVKTLHNSRDQTNEHTIEQLPLYETPRSFGTPVHEVPSALTQLKILENHHNTGIGGLSKEVKRIQNSEKVACSELERIKTKLADLSH